jgi:hypothetical protein
MMVYSKFEEELFQKQQEKDIRLERIKAVRQQEREAAQDTVQNYTLKQK